MSWVVLIASGLLEAVWAVALKLSNGFTRMGWTAVFAVTIVISFAGLAYALKHLEVGTAYAVWTGIGAATTAVIGMLWLGDSVSTVKIVSLVLIVAGIVGLNLAGTAH
ncbi:DMT family transporter [Allonocardiopsis opalescens]|uniref:Quaternary ammonium compound-resistance protein SugE n=1 Tax=Allonocardiopsis opalescens TaxID=1144618 RepID=A0A2T0PW87_9ACTN|nr:multidrug efflux SMR transporter [Allonocardiopsis opalescens]PRX95690.1 quaternary ammonium compound-resistance protein SugE [Allonocardiopsis opalescens]